MVLALFLRAPDGRLVGWLAIGACAGVYLFYRGFRLLQRKRLILNTPASKIRSASMGLVEISGQAIGPYLMTSPLKQAACYYYQSLAWELKRRGKNTEWVKVAEEVLHVPFYLDDSTDRVLVDPRGAEMDLHCDFQEEYRGSILLDGPEMPGNVSDFLVRHGVDPSRHIKIEERCIKPKNFLFVLGTLSQNPGIDASVPPSWAMRANLSSGRSEPSAENPQVIRLSEATHTIPTSAMTQQQRIAAALMKAGMGNPAAWSAAGAGAAASPASAPDAGTKTAVVEPKPDVLDSTGFDLHPPAVLMKGSHDPAFFISWRSQREVVASLGWKSALMIWGGPLLTLVCLYILLAHFRQL